MQRIASTIFTGFISKAAHLRCARPARNSVLGIALVLSVQVFAAEEPQAAATICAGCHGAGGVSSNRLVPTLAGQPYTLIEDNLLAFRSGGRACSAQRLDGSVAASLSQAMCVQVEQLDDDTIAALAAWFESREFEPARQEFDQALAAMGGQLHRELGCERCHADGGRQSLGMAPILAGQWTPFLRRTLHAVRSGLRRGPVMMNEPLKQLGDHEIEALLNFYASRPGQPRD